MENGFFWLQNELSERCCKFFIVRQAKSALILVIVCTRALLNRWLWVIWVSIMNHQQDIFIALKDIHSAIRFNGQMSMDISIVARLKEKGYSLYYYAIYTFFSSPFQSYCSKNGIRRAVQKIKVNFMILCHWHMLAPTKC